MAKAIEKFIDKYGKYMVLAVSGNNLPTSAMMDLARELRK